MTTLALIRSDDRLSERPNPEIRAALLVGGAFFTGLLGWGAVARLDAAAYASGAVKVSGAEHVLQSADGGYVSAVHVREGQRVAAGTVLVEFATTQALAQERSLAIRVIALEAEIARLSAQLSGASTVAEPVAFATLTGVDRTEAEQAMVVANRAFAAWHATRTSEQHLTSERIAQLGNQLGGYAARQMANSEQLDLNRRELDAVRTLAAKGFAPQTRVLALERTAADLTGQRGAQVAEMARLRNEAAETRMQLVQTRAQGSEQLSAALRQAQTDLQSILPQWRAAKDMLARTQLRAPIAGAVTGLTIHAAGAVATPGQVVLRIVPEDRALSVEAKVAPAAVNDLAVGQAARVRLGGLSGPGSTPLDGTVTRVSADSFADPRTGESFYTATIRVAPAVFAEAARSAGTRGPVRPGTPAQVEITLRKRTALQYLVEPLTRGLNGALHER